MAIRWTFKHYLASQHQIYTSVALQKKVVEKTGIVISMAQLCKLTKRAQKMIRFETAEILCSALECKLSDFLTVTAKQMNPTQQKKLSYKNTPLSKIGTRAFPVPANYKTDK